MTNYSLLVTCWNDYRKIHAQNAKHTSNWIQIHFVSLNFQMKNFTIFYKIYTSTSLKLIKTCKKEMVNFSQTEFELDNYGFQSKYWFYILNSKIHGSSNSLYQQMLDRWKNDKRRKKPKRLSSFISFCAYGRFCYLVGVIFKLNCHYENKLLKALVTNIHRRLNKSEPMPLI